MILPPEFTRPLTAAERERLNRPAANWRGPMARLVESVARGLLPWIDPKDVAERFADAGPRIGDLPSALTPTRDVSRATAPAPESPADAAERARAAVAERKLDEVIAKLKADYRLGPMRPEERPVLTGAWHNYPAGDIPA